MPNSKSWSKIQVILMLATFKLKSWVRFWVDTFSQSLNPGYGHMSRNTLSWAHDSNCHSILRSIHQNLKMQVSKENEDRVIFQSYGDRWHRSLRCRLLSGRMSNICKVCKLTINRSMTPSYQSSSQSSVLSVQIVQMLMFAISYHNAKLQSQTI